jgi:hypothetical protein
MIDPGSRYQEMRDIWSDYSHRQEFEHELLNRKTLWLLTTETIIFAAYGLTFQRARTAQGVNEFRNVLEWSGLLIALVGLFGVLFLIRSKARSWRTYEAFYARPDAPKPPRPLDEESLQWGVTTGNTRLTLAPEIAIPLLFIGAWCVLIV